MFLVLFPLLCGLFDVTGYETVNVRPADVIGGPRRPADLIDGPRRPHQEVFAALPRDARGRASIVTPRWQYGMKVGWD